MTSAGIVNVWSTYLTTDGGIGAQNENLDRDGQ